MLYIVFLNRLLFGKGGSETLSTVQDPNRKPEEEISRLAEKYQLSLLRLCFAYLHDRTLAEDAVQETFLKAYRSISSFRNESSEKTWLSHIAINCCRDMNKSAWARFFDTLKLFFRTVRALDSFHGDLTTFHSLDDFYSENAILDNRFDYKNHPIWDRER